jgi:hypothetical protein
MRPVARLLEVWVHHIKVSQRNMIVTEWRPRLVVWLPRLQGPHRNLNINHRLRCKTWNCGRADVLDATRQIPEGFSQSVSLCFEGRWPGRIIRHYLNHCIPVSRCLPSQPSSWFMRPNGVAIKLLPITRLPNETKIAKD